MSEHDEPDDSLEDAPPEAEEALDEDPVEEADPAERRRRRLERILPQATASFLAIKAGKKSLMALEDDVF